MAFGPNHQPPGRGHAHRTGAQASWLATGAGRTFIRRCGRADRGPGKPRPCTCNGPLRTNPVRPARRGEAPSERGRWNPQRGSRGRRRPGRGKPRRRHRAIHRLLGGDRDLEADSRATQAADCRLGDECAEMGVCPVHRTHTAEGIPFTRHPRAVHGRQAIDTGGSRGDTAAGERTATPRARGVREPRAHGPGYPS